MSVEWLRQTKLLMNQCCSLTSLTGCECAVCIDCNITASVARRRAAACMVMIWWSSVPSRTGPLSSLCLIVIHWCPHPHTATLPPRAQSSDSYPPAAINLGPAQLGGWGNPSGQKSWTQIVVIASPYRYLGPGTELALAQLYCARCFRPLQASIGKT